MNRAKIEWCKQCDKLTVWSKVDDDWYCSNHD